MFASIMGAYMSSDVPAVSSKPDGGETVRATHNNNDGDQQTVLIPVDASKEAEIAFECKLSHRTLLVCVYAIESATGAELYIRWMSITVVIH